MPQKGDTQINNFVGGLITEASPLSFPENASLDEINFKLNRDGTRWRRLGLDFEDDYQLNDTGFTDESMARSRQRFFRWPSPSGNVDIEIGVVQIGGALYFADLFTENPSANLLNSGNSVDSGLRGNVVLDFTIINNDLLVVGEAIPVPFILSYDADTDTITKTDSAVKIRDFYGVDDGIGVGVRPTTLTNNHEYNLRNQGWSDDIVTTCGNPVLQCTFDELGKYPSNSDTWSLGKIADVTDADIDKYDPNTLLKNSFNIGQAPKGRFIIDLYDRGNSRKVESGVTVSAIDRETGLLSVAEAYAGRMFYSGIKSKILGGDSRSVNMSAAVLFSQIVRNKDDMHKCYQQADPTSPTDSDVVDTDGGIVFVSGAVNIVKLLATKTSLFVFAENGIWEIRGDDGGFRATSFQVNKVSSIGVFSPESIVEANGTIFFWAKEGIFAISPNQLGDAYDSTNLTITTIQRHYNSLPNLVKQAAKGYYDAANNSIRWLFSSDEAKVVGEPIEIQPPIDAVEVGEYQVQVASATVIDAVRVSDTKYMMVYNNGSTEWVAQIVTVDPSTTAITLGSLQTFDSSIGSVFAVRVSRMSSTKYFLYTETAGGGKEVRILTLSGDTVSDGTPATVTFTASFLFGDIESVSDDYGVIVSRNSSTGALRFLPVTLTSGTPVMGTEVLSAHTANLSPVLCYSTGSTVYVNGQSNCFSIEVSSSISEDSSKLDTSSELFQGGNLRCHVVTGGQAIVTNTGQVGILAAGDPVSYVANSEGDSNIVSSQGELSPGGHNSGKFGVVYAYSQSGVSTRSLGMSVIVQGADGDADTIPSIVNQSGTVTISGTDVISATSIQTGNLRTAGDTFFYACTDTSNQDVMTGVIKLGE